MIRVLIERRIFEGHAVYYDSTIKRVVSRLVQADGCLGGESLKDADNGNRRFVMSKWDSLAAWQAWFASASRREVLAEITPLLEGNERITILETTQ